MTTPYSSFASIDKYQTKEWPVPFSAHAEVYREPLAYFTARRLERFNLDGLLGTVKNIAGAATAVAGAVKAVKPAAKPVLTPAALPGSLGYVAPQPVSWWTTPRIIGVAAGSALLIAIAIIVIIKLRK